jgi:transcriptional/translational regulatory protein YebC/TACO1
MAGHSKWANIKHKKAAQDAKRGKIFTKLIREITVAAKMGGGEPADNPRLRAAVDKALSANMTKDTIQRAIDRGAGGGDNDNVEELVYEGYGPGGVAVLVEVMTDNKNRTVAEVRHVVMEAALEAGAEDVISQDDGSIDVATTQNDVIEVKDALVAAGVEILSAEVALVPSTTAELDEESAPKVMKLIDMLEDLDDVQNVYTNANFTDELLELLG